MSSVQTPGKMYKLILDDDNSLKQLFDRFYIVPKDHINLTCEDKHIIEKYSVVLSDESVANGCNGYIVFRGKRPKKLTSIQVDEIRSDNTLTQRDLAFKYNVGVATINKIKNNRY